MKPLSELEKKWREEADSLWRDGAATASRRKRECADELQAWLREADEWAGRADTEFGKYGLVTTNEVRGELLGTTRTEGKK